MIERQGLFPPLRVTSAEPGLALFGDGSRQPGRFSSESGQASVFVVLALGLFLLGAIGGAVDIANLWFHRQAAQTAADAACTAGAMDMLAQAEGSASYSWITGKTSDCKGTTNVAPCQYAALNGYDGSGLIAQTPSNKVALSYPASVSGVTTPPAGLAPTPFLQVNITDRVKVFFLGMLSGNKTMDVGAKAVCGLVQAKSPVPIIVLNPTCQHAFQVSGSAQVNIIGGPSRSIQVNSNNTTCAAATQNSGCPTISQPGGCPAPSNSAINLCQGGPNFDGSSFGVTGAPGQPASGFNTQNDGTWSVAAPISDPYAQVPVPSLPALSPTNSTPLSVGSGVNGCPDTAGCDEYQPGLYNHSIIVQNRTAIFDPGIYYIKPSSYPNSAKANCGSPSSCTSGNVTGQCKYDLLLLSGSLVRPSNVTGNGNGAMFYFSGPGASTGYGSVYIDSNSGKRSVASFPSSNIQCPGGDPVPSQVGLPSNLNGNVLMGQCTSKGTYIGAPGESSGGIRGLLFFDDRANNDLHGQPSMQGGGGLLLAGSLYFHNCPGSPSCSPSTDFNAFVQLQGTPSSGTYVLGNITTDELVLSGNGSISMALNPNAIYNILKASLLQ